MICKIDVNMDELIVGWIEVFERASVILLKLCLYS
jgi:hypothetical protein